MNTSGSVAPCEGLPADGQVDCRRGKQCFGAVSATDMASSNRDVCVDHVSIPQRFIETGEKNPARK